MSIYEKLIEEIKNIETENLSDNVDKGAKLNIVEKQKVYFWIRIMLKDESSDLVVGDDIEIKYLKSGESLKTKFAAFGKKSLNRNVDNIVSYDPEDDKKILCLMVDEDEISNSDSIPFIRTLFKNYRFYEFQVYRREELTFTNLRSNEMYDYIDADF
jgi:hypothetical protein